MPRATLLLALFLAPLPAPLLFVLLDFYRPDCLFTAIYRLHDKSPFAQPRPLHIKTSPHSLRLCLATLLPFCYFLSNYMTGADL